MAYETREEDGPVGAWNDPRVLAAVRDHIGELTDDDAVIERITDMAAGLDPKNLIACIIRLTKMARWSAPGWFAKEL